MDSRIVVMMFEDEVDVCLFCSWRRSEEEEEGVELRSGVVVTRC